MTAQAADASTQAICPAQAAKYTIGSYGTVEWLANPNTACGYPGDSYRICDNTADGVGLGIERYSVDIFGKTTYLDSSSTAGHNSPYCTGFDSYNVAEGTLIKLVAYTVKGGAWSSTGYSINVQA